MSSTPEDPRQAAITTSLAAGALATPEHGLTAELAARLVAAAERIPHVEQIAFSCSVAPHTLIWWLKQGLAKNAQEPFKGFTQRFFAAESRALDAQVVKLEAELDQDKPKAATARLAYLRWRFGEAGQGGTRPGDALHRLLREG